MSDYKRNFMYYSCRGKNERMGKEKAFLRIGKRTIIKEQKDILRSIFDDIIIVTNNQDSFRNLDIKVVKDIIPDCGPLGGLHSGLSVCSINSLETIKNHLEIKNLKLINILNFHRVNYISLREVKRFDPEEFSFLMLILLLSTRKD